MDLDLNFGRISVGMEPKTLFNFQARLKRYEGFLQAESEKALRDSAEIYYLILIGHIGESRGGEMVFADTYWDPLSEKWLDIKRRHGWTEEIWEATGEIKQSIKVFNVEKVGNQLRIYVGLKDVAPDVMKKALINEFGSFVFIQRGWGGHPFDVPARPLFEPAKREILHSNLHRAEIVKNFTEAAKTAFLSLKRTTPRPLLGPQPKVEFLKGGVIKYTNV